MGNPEPSATIATTFKRLVSTRSCPPSAVRLTTSVRQLLPRTLSSFTGLAPISVLVRTEPTQQGLDTTAPSTRTDETKKSTVLDASGASSFEKASPRLRRSKRDTVTFRTVAFDVRKETCLYTKRKLLKGIKLGHTLSSFGRIRGPLIRLKELLIRLVIRRLSLPSALLQGTDVDTVSKALIAAMLLKLPGFGRPYVATKPCTVMPLA